MQEIAADDRGCLSDSPGYCQEREKQIDGLQFVVFQTVPDVFRHSPQISESDLPGVIVVEQLKRAPNLLHWITREYSFAH